MTTRRNILKGTGATTLTLGLAGCLNRLPFVGSDDEDGDEDTADAEETDHEEGHDDAERDEQEDDPEDTDEDNTDEDDAEDAEQETDDEDEGEGKGEDEDEENTVPDREDVEPDEDDYEDHEQREVVERDPSDIEIDVTGTGEENGTVSITGTVENVSEEYIDAVDIRFEFQDEAGESVGRQLVNVHDIDAGESVEFDEEIFGSEFDGPVEAITVTSIEVYGFENGTD